MKSDLLFYILERLATHGDRNNNTAVVYGCTIKFITHDVGSYKIRGLIFDSVFIDESSEIH